MRKRATEDPETSLRDIYNTEIDRASEDGVHIGVLPTFDSVRSSMYRRRRNCMPALPRTLRDIVLPQEYTMVGNDEFLIANEGLEDKVLIFSTRKNLEILCAAPIIYGDGTFFAAPLLFGQLYTLHALYHNQMLPLVFALLPSKDEATYMRMFTALDVRLAQLGLLLNPQIFMLDFELAVHNAWNRMRPNRPHQTRGCLFHFTQCIWRKMQHLGLQQPYNNDMAFQSWARMLLALPLLPTYEVENVFQLIQTNAPIVFPAVFDLLAYMRNYWINDDSATFPIPVWNHFANCGPRTTNHLEGWHRKFNDCVGQ